ncbi:MAG: cell division protein FtsH, partial [Alphaproteobacteria bacterium]
EEAEDKAREILTVHIDQLHAIAGALLEYETLGKAEVEGLLRGEGVVRDPDNESPSSSSGKRASVPSSGAVPNSSSALTPKPQPGA